MSTQATMKGHDDCSSKDGKPIVSGIVLIVLIVLIVAIVPSSSTP